MKHKITHLTSTALSTTPSLSSCKKTKITSLITAGILGTALASQAASVILIDDDFSSSSAVNDNRFNKGDIDTDTWRGSGAASPWDWSVTGGALTNVGTTGGSAHLINSVSSTATWLTRVTLSFDYSVGAGSTLYFYSTLFTGEADATMAARTTKTDGTFWSNDFSQGWSSFTGFNPGTEYGLSGGNPYTVSTANAVTSFVGGTSGTFSQTYDISGFGGGDFSIADVSNVLAVFAFNAGAPGDGAISIDNFNMTAIPEPSSTALLGLGGLALALRRRRADS